MESPRLAQKLHTAARRYCTDRIRYWTGKYAQLEAAGRTGSAGGYSDEALSLYPRYNLLGKILDDIECFAASDFVSLQQAREILGIAGGVQEKRGNMTGSDAIATAEAEEREAFRRFVAEVSEDQLSEVADLPYRRALTETEHRDLFKRLVDVWGEWYGGAVGREDLPPNVTLHDAGMDAPQSYELVRESLQVKGIHRIFELREHGCGYEIDTVAAEFRYTGAEGFWTDREMRWMIYASHESSITFGGEWLIEGMRKGINDFDRWIYKGWDENQY